MKILFYVVAILAKRTKYFLQVWRIIASYNLILEIVQRIKIPFAIELEQKNILLLKQERSRLGTNGSGEKVEKRMHSKFFYRIEQNLPLTIFTKISMFDV